MAEYESSTFSNKRLPLFRPLINPFTEWYSGPLLAFIGVIVYEIIDHFSVERKLNLNEGAVICAFMMFVIGEAIHQRHLELSSQHFLQNAVRDAFVKDLDLPKKIDKIIEGLQPSATVMKIRADHVNAYLVAAFERAKSVHNTFIGIRDITGYDSPYGKIVEGFYSSVLKKEGSIWHDLVGMHESLDGRFDSIDFIPHPEFNGLHKVDVVATRTPVLNFVLCSETEGRNFTEVFFGWVRDGIFPSHDLFYTRDSQIINLFEVYFRSFLTHPTRVISSHSRDFVNKNEAIKKPKSSYFIGHWISVDGNVTSLPNSALGISTPRSILKEYVRLEILCKDDWFIKGECLSFPSNTPIYYLTSENCFLSESKLYFSYRIEYVNGGNFKGIGTYELSESRDYLTGYYARERTAKTGKTRARKSDGGSLEETLNRVIEIQY